MQQRLQPKRLIKALKAATAPRHQARLGGCDQEEGVIKASCFFFSLFTLVTGPRRFWSLKLSDTGVHEL